MNPSRPSNTEIADTLDEVADLLDRLRENPFRAASYRRAAATLRGLDRSAVAIARDEGEEGLRRLGHVGEGLAGAIKEIADTGRLGLIGDLRARLSPEKILCEVPGVGEKLARRIHSGLGVASLEELELAAHGGRLENLEGIGPEKAEGIRNALAGMLSRAARSQAARRRERGDSENAPPVALILDLDAEYREKAAKDELRKIAPKRFNPRNKAWLPIMKAARAGWSFTLLFSNTKHAHDLGKTGDWVVVYWEKGGEEGQCTVVTAARAPLKGKRAVRGRETECLSHCDGGG